MRKMFDENWYVVLLKSGILAWLLAADNTFV